MTAPDHQRLVGRRSGFEHRVLGTLADDDDSVGAARGDQARQPGVHGRQDFLQQHAVAALGDLVGEMAQHLDEKRVRQRLACFVTEREYHADCFTAPQSQIAGRGVDDIAAVPGNGDNLFALFLGYQRTAGEGPGDR